MTAIQMRNTDCSEFPRISIFLQLDATPADTCAGRIGRSCGRPDGGVMHKIEFESGGRSMRWYEWLVGLLLLAAVAGVRAESVYKCVDAKGDTAYQQVSCGPAQQQSTIAIAPAPRYAPSPHYVLARKDDEPRPRSPATAHGRA